MRKPNSLPASIFVIIPGIGLAFAWSTSGLADYREGAIIAAVSAVVAYNVAYSITVADQWERVVVPRLGRFRALEGPGLFSAFRSSRSFLVGSSSG